MARSRVRTRERRLLVGGRGWHVRARPCIEGKGRRARAVGFRREGTNSTSATRSVHAAGERAAPSPEREHAVERSRVCTLERRLLVGGRSWHVGARPCTEGKGRFAAALGVHRPWADSNQLGVTRTCRKRVCCASSRERARGGAFACAHTRTPAARRRPQLARRSTTVHRGKGSPRCRIRRS